MDREIPVRFAPQFHQGVIGSERFDYITNFDFDGDWHGDNNWEHAADTRYPMKAYVYYSVSETPTHYFIHYAAFHPRDWKGGEKTGRFLSGTIRNGTTVGGTIGARGVLDDLVLSHENDLEGCLVVAAKHGARLESARVVLVETMAHNQYLRFTPEPGPRAIDTLRVWKAASGGEGDTFGETVDYGDSDHRSVRHGGRQSVDCRAAPNHDRDDRLGASRSGRRAEQGAGSLGVVRRERARPAAWRVVLRPGRYGPASRWCGDRAMGDGLSAPAVSRRDPQRGDRNERVGCGRPAVNAFPYFERHRASTYPRNRGRIARGLH